MDDARHGQGHDDEWSHNRDGVHRHAGPSQRAESDDGRESDHDDRHQRAEETEEGEEDDQKDRAEHHRCEGGSVFLPGYRELIVDHHRPGQTEVDVFVRVSERLR